MQEEYISVGKILNFHGIAGEVKVGYTRGKEYQLLGEKIFYIKNNQNFEKLSVSKLRFHKGFALIKFEEINSINDAVVYKGQAIYIPKENLRKNLTQDEFLIDDLVGLDAYSTDNILLGKISCINKQGESDLLSIKNSEGKEFFVPFVKELVPVVDIENKRISINAIEGLIE